MKCDMKRLMYESDMNEWKWYEYECEKWNMNMKNVNEWMYENEYNENENEKKIKNEMKNEIWCVKYEKYESVWKWKKKMK